MKLTNEQLKELRTNLHAALLALWAEDEDSAEDFICEALDILED